jgi:CheY-like chemotaxis protein
LTRTQRGAERIAWTLRSISTRGSAGARRAARRAATGTHSGRARVMIVDDESMVCDALAALLARDYDVATFTDPHAALASMLDGPFDVFLCDLMMPELSGIDLYERLAAQRPELTERVIFLSAGVFTERARNFLATTRRAQLHKPVRRDELVDVIEAHLAPLH